MKALIVIDMQKEFMNGLYNREGLIKNIQELIEKFQKNKQLIIFTQDYHTSARDKEFEKWGKHCLKGTEGVKIIGELSRYRHELIRKKRYSAFFNTGLNELLKKNRVKKLFIAGICTGHCIFGTALDAYYNDYDVRVIGDATSTYNHKKHKTYLKLIETLAAKIIATSHALKE